MPNRIAVCVQKQTHDNYSAAVGPVTKTLPARTNTILIQNMDATNNVLVSFDGGTLFKTIGPGTTLDRSVDLTNGSYVVKSSAATPAVECIYGSEI